MMAAEQSDQFLLVTQHISDTLHEFHADPDTKIDAYKLEPAEQEGTRGYRLNKRRPGTRSFLCRERAARRTCLEGADPDADGGVSTRNPVGNKRWRGVK